MTKFETGNLKLGNTRYLVKSHVKSHVRATKTGKHIQVKSYDTSVIKNPKWKSRKWQKQYIEDYRTLISRPLLTSGMKKRKKRMEEIFKLRTGLNIKKFMQVKEGIYAQQTQKDLPNYLINRGVENYKELDVKSPEFKAWFGDWEKEPGKASKVVDKNGKPLTVYHGTHYGGFKAFDPNTLLPGLMGKGFYFTEDKKVAESYTEKGTTTPFLGTSYDDIYNLQDIEVRKVINNIAGQRVKENEKNLAVILKMLKESEEFKHYGEYYELGRKYGYGVISHGWLTSRRAALKKRIASLKSVPNMTDVELNQYIDKSKYRHKEHMPTDREFYDLLKKNLKPLEPMTYSVYLNIRKPLNMDDPIPESLKQKVLAVPEIKEGLKKSHDEQAKYAPYGFTFNEKKYKKLYKEKLVNAKTYLTFYVALKELTALKVGMFGDTVDKEHLNDLIIKKIVKENGYDGITHIGGVVTNSDIKHRVWITLQANQIKAKNNRGTFSKKSIDIYKSLSNVRFLIKGRKLHYKTEVQGLPISVENRKGSIRRGKDGKGEWQTKMTAPYGYIRQTLGTDGDMLDCFIGKDKDSQWVYIIHIKDPKTGKYDEDKTFLGFSTFKDAMKVFKQNYDDWSKYYQGFDVMDMETFKKRIEKKGKKIEKSHVKGHIRTTKTGKVVNIRDYENVKTKKPADYIINKILMKYPDFINSKYDMSTPVKFSQKEWYVFNKNLSDIKFTRIFMGSIDNRVTIVDRKINKPVKYKKDDKYYYLIIRRPHYKNDIYEIQLKKVRSLKSKIKKNDSEFNLKKSVCYIMKSWSSSMQAKHPGGKWITVTDKSSPMAGRHIFIVPHKDGTATIAWAPHHSGLIHKVLQPKKEGKSEAEERKPEKEKPEMNEEERLNAMERKKNIEREQKRVKTEMHEKIRSKLGIETEVTKEEKSKIERDISKIADKRERNIERLKQFNKIKTERDKAIDEVIGEAKEAMLGSDRNVADMPIEKKQLREVIKENAEEFLKYHYQIKAYKREKSVLSKILKQGGKYRGGTDVVEIKPMSADEIRQVLVDEKAVEMEIEDHYRLIINTRGGIGKNGEEIVGKGTGSETIAQNIRKGGFEAMTGITGEATGSSIIDMDRYKTLGSGNAAVLMNYYFENSMGKERYAKEISGLKNYIEKEGQKVAKQGIDNGDKYLDRAQRIKEFGRGKDALFGDRVQANATALQYIQRAYESYGQAEGSLNQVAELLYQFENKKRNIEYNSNSRQKLNSIRDRLKLNKSDVHITKLDDGYKLVIRPGVFEKLIKEKPVVAKEYGAVSTADIKAGKANTDNYLPEGLRSYLPPDSRGVSQKIVLAPHQQSAARLVVKEKRVYLNHEAGTGKSLSYLASIAAIKEQTDKMPKTVISMPKKLMPNFQDEVKKFSDFNVVIVDSTDKATREKLYNSDPNTIVLVNKEKYLFDHDMIKNAGFDMMIVDEAHKSGQREGRSASGMSRGLSDLASNMEYFIAGTGSPTPNDLSELYFYLKTIDPEKYSSQKQFMEKYKNLHRGAGLKDKLAEVLHKEIDDRVFTVKKDLQHTFNQHIHNAELSDNQRTQYKQVMSNYRAKKIDVLQRDQRLNRILNSTKYEDNNKFSKMGQVIDSHIKTKGADEKVIIYAQQYKTVNEIERYLKAKYPGQGIVRFDGKTKLDDIDGNKTKFRTDKNIKFAIHTDAGTEGLNLQYTGTPGEHGATTAIAMASGANSYSTIDQFFSRANRTGVPKAMNIDGHLVLTDTPHDIRTEMRLEDKKAVMSLVDNAKRIDDQEILQTMQKSITFVLR